MGGNILFDYTENEIISLGILIPLSIFCLCTFIKRSYEGLWWGGLIAGCILGIELIIAFFFIFTNIAIGISIIGVLVLINYKINNKSSNYYQNNSSRRLSNIVGKTLIYAVGASYGLIFLLLFGILKLIFTFTVVFGYGISYWFNEAFSGLLPIGFGIIASGAVIGFIVGIFEDIK